ncbi:MAG: hypothetical protein JW944_08105 [Deltaproteobacteria bacterium]|nr:hypothetical protein [Deltaproteobacteria bacterium]
MSFKRFLLRLPIMHYRLEIPELLQAILLIAVGLSAVPLLEETLGMTKEVALTVVAVAEILGVLHVTFGDPVVPGWVASALSLILVFLSGYAAGPDSIHAIIALQILVAFLFIILGVTGLAHRLMKIIPVSLKSGILLGAAFAAIDKVVKPGGYFEHYPVSIGAGGLVTFIVLFSMRFKVQKQKSRLLAQIGKYGMLPGLVVAMIVGPIMGEISFPDIEWGFIPLKFGELFKGYSVFSIGFPSMDFFISALPMAFAVYIIAFGEIITAEAVLKEAEAERPGEEIRYNSNGSNIISGVRNLLLALFAPFVPLAGPLWAAVSVSIGERYKEGKEAMQSIFSGMGTFKLFAAIFVLFLPVTSLCEPVLPIALAVTLLVQGIACSYIAIELVANDKTAAGIAGTTGAIIVTSGINWGLGAGLALCLLLEMNPFRLNEKSSDNR